MNFIDILIIAFLIIFALVGLNRGFFKSLVMFAGFILVLVLAYQMKNYVGDYLTLDLPFINFSQFTNNASTMNIIMYQAVGFFVVFLLLLLVYRFIVAVTGIFEKLLKITIIFGIPSKLLGMVVGFVEGYIMVYLALFFLVQPFFDFNIIENSTYASKILEETPVLSGVAEDSLRIVNEIVDLSKNQDDETFDLQLAELILKDKVTSADVMQKLVDDNKIKIDGIEDVIEKYR